MFCNSAFCNSAFCNSTFCSTICTAHGEPVYWDTFFYSIRTIHSLDEELNAAPADQKGRILSISIFSFNWNTKSYSINSRNTRYGSSSKGLYFGPKTILIPPFLFPKMILYSPLATGLFRLLSCPFWLYSFLFHIYFTHLLPIFSFSFPLSSFSFPFLPFSFTFSPFSSSPFHIFPPNDIGCYFLFPGGGGDFPIYRPSCFSLIFPTCSAFRFTDFHALGSCLSVFIPFPLILRISTPPPSLKVF